MEKIHISLESSFFHFFLIILYAAKKNYSTENKKSKIVISPAFHVFKWNVFFKLHFIFVIALIVIALFSGFCLQSVLVIKSSHLWSHSYFLIMDLFSLCIFLMDSEYTVLKLHNLCIFILLQCNHKIVFKIYSYSFFKCISNYS